MYRPSGFPEYSPAEQVIFDRVKSIIEESYKEFGYAHIYTPAVEANEVLLAKSGNETSKQIFGLYGMAQGGEDLKDYSLHFDLTIPFARYILDHEGEITFPFKRFQIQPVRRGERAQRGRFREFWQCDIDTVWRAESKDSMLFYDAETLIVIANTLEKIRKNYFSKKSITVHYNNRKILEGLLGQETQKEELFSLFDKYYKIGIEKFETELKGMTGNADKILAFIKDPMNNLQYINNAEGIEELKELQNYLEKMNTNNLKLVFDPFITRGLDYYTGTVYETFFDDDMALGSISSGGRYDGLTKYIDPKRSFSGVGGSIGISRLMALIFEIGEGSVHTPSHYLCVNFSETFGEIAKLANTLRTKEKGTHVEIYPVADKLGKQFGYADKKGIPYVVILGTGELEKKIYKVKDLQTGTETEFPL